MGLDCVELTVAIEQSFGIQISNDVAVGLETPGKVIDYIHGLQSSGAAAACLTQRAFYRLRSALIGERLCTRGQFRSDTDLRMIVPKKARKRIWKRLKEHSDLNLPDLERPSVLSKALALLTILASLILAAQLDGSFGEMLGLTLVFSIVLGMLALWLSKPFAVCIPPETSTPALLVDHMVAKDSKRFLGSHETLTRAQIAATVKALTIPFCNERDYREDAHFVKDLGLD